MTRQTGNDLRLKKFRVKYDLRKYSFSERERELKNCIFAICSLYVIARSSVCRLSVTFVHSTQAIESFGNVFTPFGTFDIY